ncbi:hypothetical protein F4859DRAFT_493391 [Xylaria cf. heliscus]|nr:hypothetical protein F4859DRAFT_493391 [Xylaria cf. heliscus]
MARNWNEAPEVAQHSFPEVYHPVHLPEVAPSYHQDDTSVIQRNFPSTGNPWEAQRRPYGCPIPVFLLSTAIALLSLAVIGLAVGTGLETRRANISESKLAALTSNLTSIDRGCSANPDAVTGTTYTSQFLGRQTFKIYCNSNAPIAPLLSLFVGNFDDCIDACAFYSSDMPGNFPNVSRSTNTTCAAVSYIPAWTNRTTAMSNNAPGNCYLKPGPQNATALEQPQNGGIVHAAILSLPGP